MTLTACTLVPARPESCGVAAELIYATGPRVFNFVFRPCADVMLSTIATLYQRRGSMFGYGFATAATRESRMVGIELGYDKQQKTKAERMNVPYFLRLTPPRMWWHLLTLESVLATVLPPLAPDSYYISNLAVLPECRGQGVGEQLLYHAFERACTAGYKTCELDVAVTNDGAKRLYERVGMQPTFEQRHPENEAKHDIPGQWRMVLTL